MTETTPVGYYESLNFNSPMTEHTADRLVAELTADGPKRVLDVGCGWAELLLRLLAACPTATGLGIDHDDVLIDRAERNADDRNLSSRVTFSASLDRVDPADLVLNIGAEHVFGDLGHALVQLRELVRRGGRLLLGTQFWEQPPTVDLLEAIGELPTLIGLVDAATSTGWRPLGLKGRIARGLGSLRVPVPDGLGAACDGRRRPRGLRPRPGRPPTTTGTATFIAGGILGFAFLTLGRPGKPV